MPDWVPAFTSFTMVTRLAGRAQVWSPAPASTTWVRARVSGRRMVKRVPWPGVLSMRTRPPMPAISFFTTSRPTPRPDTPVTFSAHAGV